MILPPENRAKIILKCIREKIKGYLNRVIQRFYKSIFLRGNASDLIKKGSDFMKLKNNKNLMHFKIKKRICFKAKPHN